MEQVKECLLNTLNITDKGIDLIYKDQETDIAFYSGIKEAVK